MNMHNLIPWSRQDGRFERRIALPPGAEKDKPNAEFHNGMLTVTIPCSGEAGLGQRIPINRGSRH